jgi:UDP-N-acetylmuramate dehydrogenase
MNMADAPIPAMLRGRWLDQEPMSRHTSWRAGGAAQRSYVPADLDDLAAMLRGLPPQEPVIVVGLGSNLLVRDGGYAGTVVFVHGVLGDIALAGPGEIDAAAGVASPKVARFAAMHDLAGAEFLAGIPGTVGGALAMNAGCHGGETWRIVRSVDTLARDGTRHRRVPADFDIDYRHVARRDAGAVLEEWFVSARFALVPGNGRDSREQIKQLLSRRIATQPLNQANAGSVFRNPAGDYAARLIEACGLKGKRVGGACISAKHANFIVNTGGATAADIECLIEEAQQRVQARFGVALEREVRIIGAPR